MGYVYVHKLFCYIVLLGRAFYLPYSLIIPRTATTTATTTTTTTATDWRLGDPYLHTPAHGGPIVCVV